MNAFIKLNRGILKMPVPWLIWLMFLVTANMVAPLFFLQHAEAQVVLATLMASMLLMTWLTARFGFTRILGLGHILWIPLLAFLFTRLGEFPASEPLGIWIRTLIVLNAASLVIDTADVIRFIAGDRKESIPGL